MGRVRIETSTVIAQAKRHSGLGEGHLDVEAPGVRVPQHVRRDLLSDPQQVDVPLRWKLSRRAVDEDRERHALDLTALEQRAQARNDLVRVRAIADDGTKMSDYTNELNSWVNTVGAPKVKLTWTFAKSSGLGGSAARGVLSSSPA